MELLAGDQRPRLDVLVDAEKLVDFMRVRYVEAVLIFEQRASTSLCSRRVLVARILCLRCFIVAVVRIWL